MQKRLIDNVIVDQDFLGKVSHRKGKQPTLVTEECRVLFDQGEIFVDFYFVEISQS